VVTLVRKVDVDRIVFVFNQQFHWSNRWISTTTIPGWTNNEINISSCGTLKVRVPQRLSRRAVRDFLVLRLGVSTTIVPSVNDAILSDVPRWIDSRVLHEAVVDGGLELVYEAAGMKMNWHSFIETWGDFIDWSKVIEIDLGRTWVSGLDEVAALSAEGYFCEPFGVRWDLYPIFGDMNIRVGVPDGFIWAQGLVQRDGLEKLVVYSTFKHVLRALTHRELYKPEKSKKAIIMFGNELGSRVTKTNYLLRQGRGSGVRVEFRITATSSIQIDSWMRMLDAADGVEEFVAQFGLRMTVTRIPSSIYIDYLRRISDLFFSMGLFFGSDKVNVTVEEEKMWGILLSCFGVGSNHIKVTLGLHSASVTKILNGIIRSCGYQGAAQVIFDREVLCLGDLLPLVLSKFGSEGQLRMGAEAREDFEIFCQIVGLPFDIPRLRPAFSHLQTDMDEHLAGATSNVQFYAGVLRVLDVNDIFHWTSILQLLGDYTPRVSAMNVRLFDTCAWDIADRDEFMARKKRIFKTIASRQNNNQSDVDVILVRIPLALGRGRTWTEEETNELIRVCKKRKSDTSVKKFVQEIKQGPTRLFNERTSYAIEKKIKALGL